MTNLPTGTYNSQVVNQKGLNGIMRLSGTNDSPAITYQNNSATNVNWNTTNARLTFTYGGFNFSGSYNATNRKFTGNAGNGSNLITDQWEATASGTEIGEDKGCAKQ